jgi:rare lipoprotein A (peptidoglycan hydrolase)
MKSRLALSIAPILLFALGQQAHANTEVHRPGAHHQPDRLALSRHGRSRTAMLGHRHSRHVGFRHLAVRHVEGRHVAYSSSYMGVHEDHGWNPADAGISTPEPTTVIGASVHLTSFEAPMSSDRMLAASETPSQTGIASYYGGRHNGRRTSSGAIFNEHQLTAAHPTLPFGTKVLVQLAGTDRSVVVTITDRLYNRHRIIDLSEGAAAQLGMIRQGTAMVMLTPEN